MLAIAGAALAPRASQAAEWPPALDGIDDDDYPKTWTHQRVAALRQEGAQFLDVDIGWWKTNPDADRDCNELVKILQKN